MTVTERLVTRRFLLALSRANAALGGPCCSSPHLWRLFVKRNAKTCADEFHPDLFLDPLRQLLEFQTEMVNTQLFLGRLDALRRQWDAEEGARARLGGWLAGRVRLRALGRGREREQERESERGSGEAAAAAGARAES